MGKDSQGEAAQILTPLPRGNARARKPKGTDTVSGDHTTGLTGEDPPVRKDGVRGVELKASCKQEAIRR